MCCDGYELNDTGVCSFVELNTTGTSSPLVSSQYLDKMKNFTPTDLLPNATKGDLAGKKETTLASGWNETFLGGDRNSSAINSRAEVTLPTKSSASQVNSFAVVFSNENVESANLPDEKVVEVLTVVRNSSTLNSELPTNSNPNLTRLNSSQNTSTSAPVRATSTSKESLLNVTSVGSVAPWTEESGTIVPSTTEPSSVTTNVASTESLLNPGAGNSTAALRKLSHDNSTRKHNSTISQMNESRELQKTSAAPVKSIGESITSEVTTSGEPARPFSGPTIRKLSTPATTEKVKDESTIPSELTKSPRTTFKSTHELLSKKVTSEFPMKIRSSTNMTTYVDDSNNETVTPVVSTVKQTAQKETTANKTTLASGENFSNELPTESKIEKKTDFEGMEETTDVIRSDISSTKIQAISKSATKREYFSSTTAPTSKVGAVLTADEFASEEPRSTKMIFGNGTSIDDEITQTTSVTRSTVDPGTKTARILEPFVKSTSTEASSTTTSANTATVSSTIEIATEGISRNLGRVESSTETIDVKEATEPISPLLETVSSMMKSTTEVSKVRTTDLPATVKTTAKSSHAKTTTEPFPPLVDVISKPSPLPKETVTEFFPPLRETTHKNMNLKSIAQPSIAKTTTEPFPPLVDVISKPSPLPKETVTEFFPPLGETTHKNMNLKSIAQPSIAKTTTEPSPPLVDVISKPSPLPKETVTEFFPPLGKTTHKNMNLKSIAQPSIAKTTTEPFPPLVDVISKSSPLPKETVTEFFPPLGETTHKNTIIKSTAQPSIAKTTTEPFPPLVDISTKPSLLTDGTTTETFPPLVENSIATAAHIEAEHATEKTTAMSSTSGVMSEEEARIAFGNLPKGGSCIIAYCILHVLWFQSVISRLEQFQWDWNP